MLWRWLWSVWRVKGIFYNKEKKPLSELAKASVEALASGENNGNYDYPNGKPYVSTCGVKDGSWGRRCQATVISCQGGGEGCNKQDCPAHPRF